MAYECISIDEVKRMIDTLDITLFDVRDADSYRESRIPQSLNIRADNAEEIISFINKEKPLIIYCYHGNNSQWAADFFSRQGFLQVYSMDGGFEAWREKYL